MNEDVRRDLQGQLKAIGQLAMTYRQGVVTAVSPLAVDLGDSGAPYVGVSSLAGYAPVVGDVVAVHFFGNDLVVQGKVTGAATGGGGVFSAYRSSAQTLGVGSASPILFDTEERDISGWYDPSTGRFTPQRPGYYRLSAGVGDNQTTAAGSRFIFSIFKNGSRHKVLQIGYSAGGDADSFSGSCQVQANGTSDFFTVVLEHNLGVALVTAGGSDRTWFQGEMICA